MYFFEIFCLQPLFITDHFLYFFRKSDPHCEHINLFSVGLIHGRSFPFQKLVPERPGAYTRWCLLSEFYDI